MSHMICGALKAFIVRGDNYSATAVAAQLGDSEPWFFLPFEKTPADRLLAVDERYLIAVASSVQQHEQCLGVFDVVDRRRVGFAKNRHLSGRPRLLISRSRDRLTLVNFLSFRAWSLPNLEELWSHKLPVMGIIDAVERDDGTLVIKGSEASTPSISPAPPLVLLIGSAGETLASYGEAAPRSHINGVHRKPNELRLSSRGRWLWRLHQGSLFVTDGAGARLSPEEVQSIARAPLVEALKRLHIHVVYELWEAAPPAFRVRLPVHKSSLFEALGDVPDVDEAELDATIEERRSAIDEQTALGANEQVLTAARAELQEQGMQRLRLQAARATLDWLQRMVSLARYDDWRPGDPDLVDRLSDAEVRMARMQFFDPITRASGRIVQWKAGENAFTVAFEAHQREVSIDGALGELHEAEQASSPSWIPTPQHLREGAEAFLRRTSIPTIELERLDECNCTKAIDALTARIESDVRTIVWDKNLRLNFRLPEGDMSESRFFAFVGEHCPGAAPSLHRLLRAYDRAPVYDDVWADDSTAALGYAALALAKLDAEAYTSLGGYFGRRDPSHEPFGTDLVLPALAAKTRSFASMGALRFALRWLSKEELLGQGQGAKLAPRILEGARRTLRPEQFCREIERTAQEVMAQANIEKWAFASEKFSLRKSLAEMRQEEENVRDGLIEPLLRAADVTCEWDFRFLQMARRKRIRYRATLGRWIQGWRRMRQMKADHQARFGSR